MRAEVETEKKETRTCSQQTSAAKEEAGNARAGNRSWSCAYMYIAKYTTLWSCSISFGCASKPMFIFNNGTSPVFDAYIGTLSRGVLNLGVVICIPRSGSFKLKSGALLTFASNNYWPEEGALAALVDLDCRILPVSLDANHQSASGRMWFLHVYILNYSVLIHIYIYGCGLREQITSWMIYSSDQSMWQGAANRVPRRSKKEQDAAAEWMQLGWAARSVGFSWNESFKILGSCSPFAIRVTPRMTPRVDTVDMC